MPNYVRFQRSDGSTAAGLFEGNQIAVITEPFWEHTERTGEVLPASKVRLLPPCEPRSIVCVGLNYSSHLQGRPVPDPPTLFFKPLSSIAGHLDPIVLPDGAGRVDPEGEIVLVIGKPVKGALTREEALDAVFGYTCGNDVSARVWQRADGQWWRAKGSDTFGVFGPTISTDLQYDKIELTTRVNGEVAQHAMSDELIRDVPQIVQLVAAVMSLVPGDIIFTGTPGEPQALNSGDIVEVEVAGAGVLRNTVA